MIVKQNFEIKAVYDDLTGAEKTAQKIGAVFHGEDRQTDTYFKTQKGRLKLRETTLSTPYLIPYLREETRGIKHSQYEKIVVDNAASVLNIFTDILGQMMKVQKTRRIYFYQNVRIHLDRVDQLGTFIEFEAVYDPQKSSPEREKQKVYSLMEAFDISKNATLPKSYFDMLMEKNEAG